MFKERARVGNGGLWEVGETRQTLSPGVEEKERGMSGLSAYDPPVLLSPMVHSNHSVLPLILAPWRGQKSLFMWPGTSCMRTSLPPGQKPYRSLQSPAHPDACRAWGWCVTFAGLSSLGLLVSCPYSQEHLVSLFKHLSHRYV